MSRIIKTSKGQECLFTYNLDAATLYFGLINTVTGDTYIGTDSIAKWPKPSNVLKTIDNAKLDIVTMIGCDNITILSHDGPSSAIGKFELTKLLQKTEQNVILAKQIGHFMKTVAEDNVTMTRNINSAISRNSTQLEGISIAVLVAVFLIALFGVVHFSAILHK